MQADQNFRTLSEEELKRIKTENDTDFDDECIDLSDLPDELFANIERFIKKEIPGTYWLQNKDYEERSLYHINLILIHIYYIQENRYPMHKNTVIQGA